MHLDFDMRKKTQKFSLSSAEFYWSWNFHQRRIIKRGLSNRSHSVRLKKNMTNGCNTLLDFLDKKYCISGSNIEGQVDIRIQTL